MSGPASLCVHAMSGLCHPCVSMPYVRPGIPVCPCHVWSGIPVCPCHVRPGIPVCSISRQCSAGRCLSLARTSYASGARSALSRVKRQLQRTRRVAFATGTKGTGLHTSSERVRAHEEHFKACTQAVWHGLHMQRCVVSCSRAMFHTIGPGLMHCPCHLDGMPLPFRWYAPAI